MADNFALSGSYSTTPVMGVGSGQPGLETPLDEQVQLIQKQLVQYDLTADAVQAVAFGGCTQAQVLCIKVLGGKVKVRMTSADGSTQAWPVESMLVLVNPASAFTALDLTRTPGVESLVTVFLGQTQ